MDKIEILIKEYISKCESCEDCFIKDFCIDNSIKKDIVPKDYCEKNLHDYLRT